MSFKTMGFSGTEFERRPGLTNLRKLLKPKPPFRFLIVSEQKSIGRESSETSYIIKQFAEAGVYIYEYVHGECLTPENWREKVTSALLAGVDEGHREQTSERVHESHSQRARKGYVVGGRVFGYRNHHVFMGTDRDGNPLRSHVELRVDEPQAAVVRRIFELYDSGVGLKAIAKQLALDGAIAPGPFKRRDGLSPTSGCLLSTVRAVLQRDLDRGRRCGTSRASATRGAR